tara:strand:+ start:338 stop:1405 length:1068 start_codon:yes stop_codon:yes gene_type:complete
MSYKFGVVPYVNAKDKRVASGQWGELQVKREYSRNDMLDLGVESGLFKAYEVQTAQNANLKIDEMYRELDSGVTMEPKAVGKQATLQRLLSDAEPVHIGKKRIEHRRVGEAGKAGRSMSGQTGIVIDTTDSNYQAAIVPIFDAGYGRDFRDVEAQRSEMFDGLSEDAEEIEYALFENVDEFLWSGDTALVVKGTSWLGLRLDPSVGNVALAVDWSAAATSGIDILNDVISTTDVLRITNNCTDVLKMAVSPQIMSNWLRPTTAVDSTYGNIKEFVMRTMTGRIGEVYEDNALVGNQVLLYVPGRLGLHAKVGMAMSTYALKRDMFNSPYNFVKWSAYGFMSKTTYSGKFKALYGA